MCFYERVSSLLLVNAEFHKDPFLDLVISVVYERYICLLAVYCDLFLYTDDTGLLFQDKDLVRIKDELTKNFSNICDWFVDS